MSTDAELSLSALRIAEVAQALVQEVGYNGFSFEHISQAVGMRKASVHHHFASKLALGLTVVQRYTRAFEDALQCLQRECTSDTERLLAYADLFETTFNDKHHLCVCGMLGAESNSLDPALSSEVKRFFQLNVNWLQGVFEEGLACGVLRSQHDAKSLSETLLSLLEGSMLVGRHVSVPMGPRRTCEVFLSGLST